MIFRDSRGLLASYVLQELLNAERIFLHFNADRSGSDDGAFLSLLAIFLEGT
jgi:hypothetical protein